MALKALGITKEVITTPFSYVATTNAILWEGCKPVFVDIDPVTCCIDASKIEAAITKDTEAILATHVYGIPCDVEAIEAIAHQYNLKVIYDAAHAFGVKYKNKSILEYGDISTCSFHATKIFHTVEGGCIIAKDDEIARRLMLYRQFGHVYDDYYSIGINAKNSEFHAAMGICILPKMDEIISDRKRIFNLYDDLLHSKLIRPKSTLAIEYNYAYYPVVFQTEIDLLTAIEKLKAYQINARRYFYPSLNELPFIEKQHCPVSEEISKRVLCLPLYYGLETESIELISKCLQA
jgi:dTDP-4-amino-4,6-dideoxygalactose transaminase